MPRVAVFILDTAPESDVDLINALLDCIREREGFTSDLALGQYLGVSGQAIYRWRKGYTGEIGRKLLPALFGMRPTPPALSAPDPKTDP